MGEKTAADMEKLPKKKEKKKPAEGEGAGAGAGGGAEPAPLVVEEIDPYAQFPDPKDNNKVRMCVARSRC